MKKENENRGKKEEKFGEFVPSYFSWLTQEEQKKKAKELGKMTKSKKKE